MSPCFCPAQALSSRDMTTFLLRAPAALFSSCTQVQALNVLAFLKRDLGVKQEYLFPRIVCAAPGVLLQVGRVPPWALTWVLGAGACLWGLARQVHKRGPHYLAAVACAC